jgi:hypothetical protein
MKVRFLDTEKAVVVGILNALEKKANARDLRRRLSLIKNKFLTNSQYVNVKKPDLVILYKLLEVAVSQSKKLQLDNDRVNDVILTQGTISSVLGVGDAPASDG